MTPYHGLRRSRLDPVVVLAAFVAVLLFDALTSATARGVLSRVWNDLAVHPSGPFGLRFWIQPLVAIGLGITHGLRNSRVGRRQTLWAVLHDKAEWRSRLISGCAAISQLLLIGIGIDTAYQLVAFRTIYPFEAILVAALFALVPYVCARGYAVWLARREAAAPADSREAQQ